MTYLLVAPLCIAAIPPPAPAAPAIAPVDGRAVISAPAGPSQIVITTTSRVAGAIHSLTWNGKEFLDSFDHGRQLQSASNFDAGTPFAPETFNPTEAGSRADGAGPHSTSRLLKLHAAGNRLETLTQMAFWLRPGQSSLGHPAKNTAPLSQHLLGKQITIGCSGMPHVIEYVATFTVPPGEPHRFAQFEAVTGYMPLEFSQFSTCDPKTGRLTSLSDGPGEQPLPIVFATASGAHAMGIYSPDQPSAGYEHAGYGRFRFPAEQVVKWNCVFRVRDMQQGIRPGTYRFRNFVLVGTTADVTRAMTELRRKFTAEERRRP